MTNNIVKDNTKKPDYIIAEEMAKQDIDVILAMIEEAKKREQSK